MTLSRSLKDKLANLTLAFASVCVVTLLLEGVFRLVGLGDRLRSQSEEVHAFDPQLGWIKRPNTSVRLTSSEYDVVQTTNAQGLRGPERAIPKPEGVRRVLLIGDSFLEGRGVGDDSVVSRFLQARLDDAGSIEGPVEVVNGGTSGYSTDQELIFLRSRGLAYEPDVTVLLFYLNDASQNGQAFYRGEPKPHFRVDAAEGLTLAESTLEPSDSEARTAPPRGLRRVAAWFGDHSNLYRWVRSKTFGRGGVLYRFAPGSDYGEVPIEWAALQTEPDSTMARAWTVTEALLAAMRDEAEAAGSRFLVFYAPSILAVRDAQWEVMKGRYGLGGSEHRPTRDAEALGGICERLALECIIDIEAFRRTDGAAEPPGLYFTLDEHWTPSGHALAADLIAESVIPILADVESEGPSDAARGPREASRSGEGRPAGG